MKSLTRYFLIMLSVLFVLTLTVSCHSQTDFTTAETTLQTSVSSTEKTTDQPDETLPKDPTNTTTKPNTVVSSAKSTVTTASPAVTSGPEDNTPVPEKGTYIQVTYKINNTDAGSISGSKSQIVRYGESSTQAVTATPNLGYKFVGWSDGKTEAVRSKDCPRENTTYTAIFEFDALELPILDLRTNSGKDVTDKQNYVPGTISVTNVPEGFNFENLAMEIRGRGNYTWYTTFNADPMYNKRPYRIKLSEKMNLLGQGNGKEQPSDRAARLIASLTGSVIPPAEADAPLSVRKNVMSPRSPSGQSRTVKPSGRGTISHIRAKSVPAASSSIRQD